jgi:hypothetical protein
MHRHHIAGATPDKMTQSASQTGLLLGNPIGLAQSLNVNHRIS